MLHVAVREFGSFFSSAVIERLISVACSSAFVLSTVELCSGWNSESEWSKPSLNYIG